MRDRAEAMVLASFVADSHALGAHWIYDTEEIERRFGPTKSLISPPSDGFHAGKPRGSFTHYGDQTMLLLRCLAKHGRFGAESFANDWRGFMETYDGYKDDATRSTLSRMEAATDPVLSGSSSTDLAAAARIAPLAYLYRDDHDELIAAARDQSSVTHNSSIVRAASAMLAHVLWSVQNGRTPRAAIVAAMESDEFGEAKELVERGLSSVDEDTVKVALRFGQGSDTSAALPVTVHLIAKHEGSLEHALLANVAAGGDSAVRGMIAGMVLAAFHGRDAIPDEWLEDLRAYKEIVALLEDLEARIQRNGLSA